jgi:Na+-transporting NADH:ubiquinone oxidoreductase subunit NqrC
MTDKQEYMSNVKWTTALYIGASTISIVLAIAGVYYGLKGDIKDSRVEAKEQIISVATMLNKKIDSNQHINELKFQQINMKLDQPAFTERKSDGKIILVPSK